MFETTGERERESRRREVERQNYREMSTGQNVMIIGQALVAVAGSGDAGRGRFLGDHLSAHERFKILAMMVQYVRLESNPRISKGTVS